MADIIDMPPGADIFQSKAQLLVNPVNCYGRHSAGLAKAFAERFPESCLAFTAQATRRLDRDKNSIGDRFQPGDFVAYHLDKDAPLIVFVCTKDHWRQPSKLEWIETAMKGISVALTDSLRSHLLTIAIPALGCGLGGLDWADVRPIIVAALKDLDALTVELYPPHVPA